MNEFSPLKVNDYSVDELIDFINKGVVTIEKLYGIPFLNDTQKKELEKKLNAIREEEEFWSYVRAQDTIEKYEAYLYQYPEGKYKMDAKARIAELKIKQNELLKELFTSMSNAPWLYSAQKMKCLLEGRESFRNSLPEFYREEFDKTLEADNICNRSIKNGLILSFDKLKEHDVIPNDWTREILLAEDYELPQLSMDRLGEFPSGRTDIFFVGIPRSGKSSLLAGLLSQMHTQGMLSYVRQFNDERNDLCHDYYQGLIKSVEKHRYPRSTGNDTVSFMKIDITKEKRVSPVTFVEISGEAVKTMAASISGAEAKGGVWEKLGAKACMSSPNKKLLVFIVDYAAIRTGIRADDIDALEQGLILETVLNVMCTDGEGRDGTKNCTMSKVDTVAVVITKSDLMPDAYTKEEQKKVASDYINNKFRNFMNNLILVSKKYGINVPNKNQPYIRTFNLGKMCIGNKYIYDPRDSDDIINLIYNTTRSESRNRGIFNF